MRKEQLKTVLISILAVAVLLLLFLRKSEKVESAKSSQEDTSELDEVSVVETIEVKSAECLATEETNDSLRTLLNNFQAKVPAKHKLTKDERALEETIIELNKGYAKMTQSKDIQNVLKHFLPKFASNVINVGVDEKVFVDRRGSKEYSTRLEDLLKIPGFEIIMGSTKFLHLFTKGDVAIAIYLTEYETRIDGETIIKGTVLGQATCKRYNDDTYKIGNYSLVNVRDYEIFSTPTSELKEVDLE